MANTKSAKKQIRKIKRKTSINKYWKKAVKSSTKEFEEAINNNTKKDNLIKKFRKAKSVVDKAVKRRVIPKNKGSRMKSRLERELNKVN